jgi:hypothetical protein
MATSRPSKFPRVPYSSIRWLVGNFHVGDSPESVTKEIETRMKKARRGGEQRAHYTPSEIREAVRYALACHADNRKSYERLMLGRF